jgi:hypothetical protein
LSPVLMATNNNIIPIKNTIAPNHVCVFIFKKYYITLK